MSFNFKYQTVSSDFVGWTTGTLPIVAVTGMNIGDTQPFTAFNIEFTPALPANVTAYTISAGRLASYGASKFHYRMDQVSPQKFSRIDISPTTGDLTLNLGPQGVPAGSTPLISPTATTANTVPVVTDTSGTISTSASATTATLARPLAVTTGSTQPVVISGSQTTCSVKIGTTNTGSNRGSLTFGRNNIWEFGSDSNANNTDDFYIFRSGTQCLRIAGTDQLINADRGFTSKRYDLVNQAANPGGALTIWKDTALTRPSWGTLGELALLVDLPSTVKTQVTGTFTGPWAVGQSITLNLVKSGGFVSVKAEADSVSAQNSTAVSAVCANLIPAAYRPNTDVTVPYSFQDNGVRVTGLLYVQSLTGTVQIQAFTAGTGLGGVSRLSVAIYPMTAN